MSRQVEVEERRKTATTTRQAVLLSLRALGTNSNAVARADRRQSELDQLIADLVTMLTDSQKSHSLVLAAEDGKRMAVSWLLGVGYYSLGY